MRAFLIVGVKLIGVLVLYWALQHVPALPFNLAFYLDNPPNDFGYLSPGWQLAAVCLSFLFAVSFGLFLLFRGELLVAWLPVLEFSSELPDTKADELLGFWIIVAGLLIASNALPRLVVELYVILTSPPQLNAPNLFVRTLYGSVQPLDSVLQLGIAAVFIFRSVWMVKLLKRYALSTH